MADDIQLTDPILALLAENGLTQEQAAEVIEEQKRTGQALRKTLIDMGIVKEDDLLVIIANHLGTTIVNLPEIEITPDLAQMVPASVARMYNVVPVGASGNSVTLATFQLVSPETVDEIRFVLTCDVTLVMAREADVQSVINRLYPSDNASVDKMLTDLESQMENGGIIELTEGKDDNIAGLEEAASSKPVIRFVNLILYQAVQDGASDIHFEPFEKEFKIRYRVDGALYELNPPPKRLALPVISRIKVMSNLNIAERRVPQDGRLQMPVSGRTIDFRVSTLPTQFGESLVLRILDRSTVSLELENLGLPPDIYERFAKDLAIPNGIIIVTGPTGSGKTTTLYSGLRRINSIDAKLLTAEDPVEYDIEGIVQVQVHESIGVTFQRVLRAFLRQDPDIIMIGEIRDLETATIAIQASLTGHLVLSTLHTNDAPGAITRLIDMNVEPFLISSTLESVLAQRLVRKICDHCKHPYQPDRMLLDQLNLTEESIAGRQFFMGKGCDQCHQTGYRGRKGVFEYLIISDPIRTLVNDRKPTIAIRDKAIEQGMRPLREDGLRNILDGYTTAEEILKYT